MPSKTLSKAEEKNLQKTNSVVSNYEAIIKQLVSEAKESGETKSKPIAIHESLRINVLAFKDGSVMFSIAKLNQKKAIVLTLYDMQFLKQLFNEKSEQLELLLAVVSKYTRPRTQQNDEDTIL